jgi:2-polyprenyl-6-methoxyphenol hydroxylase-like FAD-dependent oxidoreductase
VQVREAALRNGAGRPLQRMSTPDYGNGLDSMLVLRRSDLQAILLDAVEAHPGIDARYGAAALAASREGRVTYEGDGHQETLSADLVVGADGVHSAVRALGQFGARVIATGISYVRGLSSVTVPVEESTEAWTPIGLFGMAPLSGGSYFFTSARHPTLAAALERRDLAAFRAAWSGAYPPSRAVLEPLKEFDELLVNEVVEVQCTHFVDGKLVLLGDAAHAMAPNLGQGANSALVDAVVLTSELRDAPSLEEALRRYDARRRPAVQQVQQLAHRLGAAAELNGAIPRTLRDTALRLLNVLPGASTRAARSAQQEDPSWLFGEAQRTRR